MAHARPFWTSTLRNLSNGIKNASMRGVLTLAIELWVFGSPRGLPSPIFESVSGDLTTPSKWGCNIEDNINHMYKLPQDKMYNWLPNYKMFATLQVLNNMCKLIQRTCNPNVHYIAHLRFVFSFSILCFSLSNNYLTNDLLTLKCLIHLLLSYWVIKKWTYQVVDLALTQSLKSWLKRRSYT
jgi:hypothetical protein